MVKSTLSLQQRLRPLRAVAAARERPIGDEAVMYLVSVVIAVAAMLMAAMAGR